MIVRKYLAPLRRSQIDTLILGCTHYPVLRNLIQRKIGVSVSLVDSAEAIAMQVRRQIAAHGCGAVPLSGNGRCRIYVTDIAEQFQKTAHLILGRRLAIEHADIQCS
jgi:glutamate racemase